MLKGTFLQCLWIFYWSILLRYAAGPAVGVDYIETWPCLVIVFEIYFIKQFLKNIKKQIMGTKQPLID